MKKLILYFGDSRLQDAARYLAGCLKRSGLSYDHVPSDQPPPKAFLKVPYNLYILSDYPGANFAARDLVTMSRNVYEGASLLMIGGWGSFKGVDGDYHKTALQSVLPVNCLKSDDRIHGALTYRIAKAGPCKEFSSFQFGAAPGIAGYNLVIPKKSAKTLLTVETVEAGSDDDVLRVTRRDPLLVTFPYGQGRVGAFMTDLAPHWSGGLVDWGKKRIRIAVSPRVEIEVGEHYHRFVDALIGLFL